MTVEDSATNNSIEIGLESISKSLKEVKVLDELDLSVRKGELMVIIGGSGSGKSVLLKHIVGIMKPDSGRVLIAGQDVTNDDRFDVKKNPRRIGMVFQGGALLNSLTVEENVALGLKEQRRLRRDEIKEIVEEKLALTGLEGKGHLLPSEISGGMKKRAALARSLAMSPDVILYDEPTAGLDPLITDSVGELIRDVKNRLDVTSVVVTHDINHAYYISDRIGMIHEGKILQVGTADEIKNSENPIVQRFVSIRW